MFCEKCGKEVSTGAAFCDYCGNPVTKEKKNRKKKNGKKKLPAVITSLVIVLIAVGAGGFWYIKSDAYQCKKMTEMAKASMEAGAYEEALAYCAEALTLDKTYMDAYIQAADTHLLMGDFEKAADILLEGIEYTEPSEEEKNILPQKFTDACLAEADRYLLADDYGDAISVLQEGMENMEDSEGYEDIFTGKLEEVYQAQADYLVGTWVYQYDLMNTLPEDAQNMAEVDMEVYFEFHEDGTLQVCVDRDFWSETVGGAVGGGVDLIIGFLPVPGHVKSIAGAASGAVSGWLAGFAAGNASVDYHYETDGNVICCTEILTEEGVEAGEASYSFVISQGTLQFLEKTSASETSVYFLECPMELKKAEEMEDASEAGEE